MPVRRPRSSVPPKQPKKKRRRLHRVMPSDSESSEDDDGFPRPPALTAEETARQGPAPSLPVSPRRVDRDEDDEEDREEPTASQVLQELPVDRASTTAPLRNRGLPDCYPASTQTEVYNGMTIPLGSTKHNKRLDLLHPHPRDAHIIMEPEQHKYCIDGCWDFQSSSGVCEDYCEKFDPEAISSKMIKNPLFPGNCPPDKVLSKYKKYEADVKHCREKGLDLKTFIKKKWKDGSEFAAARGTELHEAIEDYLNLTDEKQRLFDVDRDLPEHQRKAFRHFLRFHKSMLKRGLEIYRTEWMIYDKWSRICGCLDAVYWDPKTGEIFLRDWKGMPASSDFGFKPAKTPWDFVMSCKRLKQALQLNVYKLMFEKRYGLKIVDIGVVLLSGKNPNFVYHELPVYTMETKYAFLRRAYKIDGIPDPGYNHFSAVMKGKVDMSEEGR